MFARSAVGVHPANISLTITAKVIVGGQKVAATEFGHRPGQPPERGDHRLIMVAVNLDGSVLQERGLPGVGLQLNAALLEVGLQPIDECGGDLGRDQALDMGVAVVLVVSGDLHCPHLRYRYWACNEQPPTIYSPHRVNCRKMPRGGFG